AVFATVVGIVAESLALLGEAHRTIETMGVGQLHVAPRNHSLEAVSLRVGKRRFEQALSPAPSPAGGQQIHAMQLAMVAMRGQAHATDDVVAVDLNPETSTAL